MLITNKGNEFVSFQISYLKTAEAGDTELLYPVILKNITDDDLELEIKLKDNDDYITTVLYPGWNCEIVTAWKGAPADSIQFGY